MKNFSQFLTEAEQEKSKAVKHLAHLGGEAHFFGKNESDADLTRLKQTVPHLLKWGT